MMGSRNGPLTLPLKVPVMIQGSLLPACGFADASIVYILTIPSVLKTLFYIAITVTGGNNRKKYSDDKGFSPLPRATQSDGRQITAQHCL